MTGRVRLALTVNFAPSRPHDNSAITSINIMGRKSVVLLNRPAPGGRRAFLLLLFLGLVFEAANRSKANRSKANRLSRCSPAAARQLLVRCSSAAARQLLVRCCPQPAARCRPLPAARGSAIGFWGGSKKWNIVYFFVGKLFRRKKIINGVAVGQCSEPWRWAIGSAGPTVDLVMWCVFTLLAGF